MKKRFYPFTNHIMFALVMQDPEICKGFLEKVFSGKKVKKLRYKNETNIESEKTFLAGIESHAVRVDVLFEGDEWYDIELQAGRSPELPKRCRYYSAAIDVAHLKRGDNYNKLKPSYVIFLCLFDYFGKDQPIYFFESYDKNLQLPLNDQRYIIILNSKCSKENTPDTLKELFSYINGKVIADNENQFKNSLTDEWIKEVHCRVEAFNKKQEVANIMTLEEDFKIREYFAKQEGKKETACKLKDLGVSIEIIAEATGFTPEEIENIET